MKKINIFWVVVILTVVLTLTVSATTCSETMTRTISGNSVTYTAVGTSGAWGASIVDSVTGGCAFPSGSTTLNEVMLSTDGATKTIQLTGTLSSCTFTGDYKFGTCAVKQFGSTPCTGSSCGGDTPPKDSNSYIIWIVVGAIALIVIMMLVKK